MVRSILPDVIGQDRLSFIMKHLESFLSKKARRSSVQFKGSRSVPSECRGEAAPRGAKIVMESRGRRDLAGVSCDK